MRYTAILLFAIAVLSAVVSYIYIRKIVKRGDRKTYIPSDYGIVFSGNNLGNISKLTKSTLYLHKYNFRSTSGEVLDPEEYLLFKVHGTSMQDYGISNDNLIFCNKIFKTSQIDNYPLVVIKKQENLVSGENDRSETITYYLRRVWRLIHLETEDVDDVIKKLIKAPEFDEIYSRLECSNPRKLESDFMKLLEAYRKKESNVYGKSMICTGHFGNKIALEIYPATDVIGEVVASFDLYSL